MNATAEAQGPTIYTPATLVESMAPATKFAKELEDQASRAVVENDEQLNSATDFIKVCNAALNRAEERRTEQVKPLNDHVKWINEQWRPLRERIEKAKAKVQGLATTYAREKQRRLDEAAAAERRRIEEEALAAAAEAEALGRTEQAEQIIQATIETPTLPATRTKGRGGFTGASSSLRDRWVGTVAQDDVRQVCAAIASGVLPTDIVVWSQSSLNRLADSVGKEGVFHGVTITNDAKLVAR